MSKGWKRREEGVSKHSEVSLLPCVVHVCSWQTRLRRLWKETSLPLSKCHWHWMELNPAPLGCIQLEVTFVLLKLTKFAWFWNLRHASTKLRDFETCGVKTQSCMILKPAACKAQSCVILRPAACKAQSCVILKPAAWKLKAVWFWNLQGAKLKAAWFWNLQRAKHKAAWFWTMRRENSNAWFWILLRW